MVLITFESVPSEAEVEIDGEYTETTPFDVEIGELPTEFNDSCLCNGDVICDWGTLKPYLEDHTVSTFWWGFTESERRSIAEMAVKNTIYQLIQHYRRGEEGEWKRLASPCTYNAIIRFQKIGVPIGWADCYWKYTEASTDIYNYVPNHSFGLPCVLLNNNYHVMCGVQVVDAIDDIDNWVVFQYNDVNIKPGSPHMPTGSHVIIQRPFPYDESGYSCIGFDSDTITDFHV